MTDDEYRTLVRTINGAWPSKPWQPEHAAVWWPIFADHPADRVAAAIAHLMRAKTDPWTPAPGEIIAAIDTAQAEQAERRRTQQRPPELLPARASDTTVTDALAQARASLADALPAMPTVTRRDIAAEEARYNIRRGYVPDHIRRQPGSSL